MGIDLWALLGTGIVGALAYGLYRLYRVAQKTLQGCYDQGYVNGRAAGQKESSRLAYAQGHEDGLIEGRAQAGREQLISAEKQFNAGYEQGHADGQMVVLVAQIERHPREASTPAMNA